MPGTCTKAATAPTSRVGHSREEQAAKAEQTRTQPGPHGAGLVAPRCAGADPKPKARIESATAIVNGRPRPPPRQGDLPICTRALRASATRSSSCTTSATPSTVAARAVRPASTCCSTTASGWASSGPNGTGKSTLLDIIAGRTRPDRGARRPGTTVRLGYYDQLGATLDPNQRVRDAVTGGHRDADWTRRGAAGGVLVRRRRPVGAHRAALGWRAPPAAAAAHAGRTAQRAAARRADQRPRPRHAARSSRTSSTTGRARSWWSATTGRSSNGPSPT